MLSAEDRSLDHSGNHALQEREADENVDPNPQTSPQKFNQHPMPLVHGQDLLMKKLLPKSKQRSSNVQNAHHQQQRTLNIEQNEYIDTQPKATPKFEHKV